MFLLRFTLFFSIAVGLVIVITQIIVPLWREQPLFPWFNKSFRTLDVQKRAMTEEQMKKTMEQEINEQKHRLS